MNILALILLIFNLSRVKGLSTSLSASEVISITNAYRAEHNVAPLHPQDRLMRAAEAKANAMLAADSWSHNTPEATPWQFIQGEGYIYLIAGENLAKDFSTSEGVVKGWNDSISHRENLLSEKFTDTGVAVVEGSFQKKAHTTLVVQFLATEYNPQTDPILKQEVLTTPLLIKKIAAIDPLLFSIGTGLLVSGCLIIILYLKFQKQKKRKTRPHASHWRH